MRILINTHASARLFLSSTVVTPSESDTQPTHLHLHRVMEDSNNQQWTWVLAICALFAMYGMCSLYNWIANIFGNIRSWSQTSPSVADVIPPHPSKLTLPTFWISELAAWFALAEAKFRTSNITNQRVMFNLLVTALPEKNLSQVMDIVSHLWREHFYRLLSSRCDTEKGGGKGKVHWIDNRTRLTAVQPGATWSLMACTRRGALTRAPPSPPHTPPHRIIDRFWQPRPKSRMASI